jgi:hypothetical protein
MLVSIAKKSFFPRFEVSPLRVFIRLDDSHGMSLTVLPRTVQYSTEQNSAVRQLNK